MSLEAFSVAYGRPFHSHPAADATRRHRAWAPPALRALWQRDGFAGYADGLLWLNDPDSYEDIVDAFRPLLNEWGITAEAHVFLRSAFGHLYLWSAGQAYSFDPLGQLGMQVSRVTDDLELLFDTLLPMPELRQRILHEDLFVAAKRKLGVLAWDEAYTCSPLPALGGRLTLEALARGKIREYLAIVSQLTVGEPEQAAVPAKAARTSATRSPAKQKQKSKQKHKAKQMKKRRPSQPKRNRKNQERQS